MKYPIDPEDSCTLITRENMRREPNYVLILFLMLIALFLIAGASLYITGGHLPFVSE